MRICFVSRFEIPLLYINKEDIIKSVFVLFMYKRKWAICMAYKNPVPTLTNASTKRSGEVVEDYPMHEDVYFAFIDVLGFKQAFDENREDPQKRFATKYESIFKYYSQLMRDAKFARSGISKAGQTSDSLYFYTDRIDFMAEFIKVYLHFSQYSMSQNVFFRGGVAKGCLFVNEPHQFYGDSVIKAYLQEEKISKFPRVAFDRDTFEALSSIPEIKAILVAEQKSGRFYLKPFAKVLKNELASITGLETSQIRSIDRQEIVHYIDKGKTQFEFDDRNYPKYQFLAEELAQYKDEFE